MPTFKVVLDGIDLSAEQAQRIAESIQRSVLNEFVEVDSSVEIATDAARSFAWLAIFGVQTMGLVATQPADEQVLAGILASEFGG